MYIIKKEINKVYILNIIEYLIKIVPKYVKKIELNKDEIILYSNKNYIRSLLFFLRNHITSQMKILTDITVVDNIVNRERFTVVYLILSYIYNLRLNIKIEIKEEDKMESINKVYGGSNWYEREIWDMFGIFFYNSIDLRRILTDYGFKGNPLRKEYPVTGYSEIRYDYNKRSIVYEPIELGQEFRNYEYKKSFNSIA
jgi:NADH:ubiquinone oxidoreductase subunit C